MIWSGAGDLEPQALHTGHGLPSVSMDHAFCSSFSMPVCQWCLKPRVSKALPYAAGAGQQLWGAVRGGHDRRSGVLGAPDALSLAGVGPAAARASQVGGTKGGLTLGVGCGAPVGASLAGP